jgi:hypothetical protein
MARRKRRAPSEDAIDRVWRPLPERPFELLAIDPGDLFTGVAFFRRTDDGWYCMDAQEFAPHDFEDALAELILLDRSTPPPIVGWEKWRLYEDQAKLQKGSEFLASQHIGVIKYIIRVHNEHVSRHEDAEEAHRMLRCELKGGQCHDPALRPQRVATFVQGAEIKTPTRGILRFKKIKSVAKPIAKEYYHGRDHVIDAELHGWKHIMDTLEERPAALAMA